MLKKGDKLICKTNGLPETEFCIRGVVKSVVDGKVTISRALKFGQLPMDKDLTLPEEELLSIEQFDEDTVKELRSRARTALLTSALEREELLKWADKSLVDLPGMTHEIANKLKPAGIKTLDQLADLSTDELVEMTGIDHDKAAALITKARESWS